MISKPVGGNPPPLFTRPRPAPRSAEDRVVYAIGSRVLITASSPGQRVVDLMDEKGHPSTLKVAVDAETEVTAWRPQRTGAARYRIRAADGTEGWLEASNVRRKPVPIAIRVAVPVKAPTPPPKPPRKKAVRAAKPATNVPAGAMTTVADPKAVAKAVPAKATQKTATKEAPKGATAPAATKTAAPAARPAAAAAPRPAAPAKKAPAAKTKAAAPARKQATKATPAQRPAKKSAKKPPKQTAKKK